MWENVSAWAAGLVLYGLVLRPLTDRLDRRLRRRGSSVNAVLTGPAAELLFGAWMTVWFFSEVVHDIPAHYEVWQIVVSLVLVVLGVALVVHALLRWKRPRETG